MIDPWITGNPKTPPEYKNLDKLGKIDVILVTHGHGDHFGDAIATRQEEQRAGLGAGRHESVPGRRSASCRRISRRA